MHAQGETRRELNGAYGALVHCIMGPSPPPCPLSSSSQSPLNARVVHQQLRELKHESKHESKCESNDLGKASRRPAALHHAPPSHPHPALLVHNQRYPFASLLAWHILTSEVDEANQRLRDALTFERTHER